MSKKHIAVIMGGYSSEFEISLQSGAVVCEALDSNAYDVYPVHIFKEEWYYLDAQGEKHPVDKGTFSFHTGNRNITPDVVFNTVHGTPGEDGYLASYFELLGIPQTSTGFYQAALSFNKRDCLTVLKKFGIHCADSVYMTKGMEIETSKIIDQVGLPCFVKPNRAGSSFGVSRVTKEEDLIPAIEAAYEEDFEILIESELVGIEVSVGAYRKNGAVKVLSPTEIVSENDFFDYAAKYLGKSQEITPARISEEDTQTVQRETRKVYELLNMEGVTRSDFILKDGIPYLIETNTTPGLSKESIIPKQALEAGMTLTEFFGILVEEALKQHH